MHRNTDLAEIVKDPSPITRKYLNLWFTGKGAYGKALTMLGWPIVPGNDPLLDWNNKDGLRVNLKAEEKIMYAKTIFRYTKQGEQYKLHIDLTKILSPAKIYNTLKATWSQSRLLIDYQKTFNLSKKYVESIPLNYGTSGTREEVEYTLSERVWPYVIAVDYIGEYILSVMTYHLSAPDRLALMNKIHKRVRELDWYTQAMLAWNNYKEGLLSQQELLAVYGYAAGDDYELTKPRYYELLKKSKPKITDLKIKEMSIKNLEDLAVGMHYLRSEAKRRSLIWIAELRELTLPPKLSTN